MTALGDVRLPDNVDQKKANRLINWIVDLEDDNDKTARYDDSAMIQKIGKQIKDEVKCL